MTKPIADVTEQFVLFSFGHKSGKMSEFELILDSSRQNLREVPPRILDMRNLKMLYLQQNFLKKLPNDFFLRLPSLSWLDLRHNHLTAIPESIAHHQNLENLLLSDNKISLLPNELGLVPNLKVLQIANNPIVYPSSKVIASGTKLICLFLKSQYEKELASMTEELSKENHDLMYPPKEDIAIKKIDDSDREFSAQEQLNPSFIVKGLSKATGDDQIVHQISRDKTSSKVLIKSYFDDVDQYFKTQTDHNVLLKNTLKQEWIDKLKILLEEQEKVLQQEKNLQALSSWRHKKKTEPTRNVTQEERTPPYATYPEYDSILSREELIKQIDRLIEHNTHQPKRENIEVLINDLISQLKEIESSYAGIKSPRSEIEAAGNEIIKVMEVHKKLLQLQQLNNKF